VNIRISPQDGLPLYRQIMQQIKHLVASGRLRPGDELLPVRVLAEQLLINPNTVVRAYRELELEGVLYKRRGAGTYVAEGKSPLAKSEQRKRINELVDGLVVEAAQLNIDLDSLVDTVRRRAEQWKTKGGDQRE